MARDDVIARKTAMHCAYGEVRRTQDMPDKYIYEPWTAPPAVQASAKCIIGKDYPRPIVDHAAVSKANMTRMKDAYAAGRVAGAAAVVAGAKRAASPGAGIVAKRAR